MAGGPAPLAETFNGRDTTMEKILNTVMALVKGGKWGEAARICRANGICGFTDENGTSYEVEESYYKVITDMAGFAAWLSGLGLEWLDGYTIGAFIDEVMIYNGNRDYAAQFNVKVDDIRRLLRKDGIEIPNGFITTAVNPYIKKLAA